jgi:uncharacterized protein with gpF-like domain
MSPRTELIEQNRIRQRMELRFEKRLQREFNQIGDQAAEVYESEARLRILLDGIEQRLLAIFQPHYRAVLEEFSRRQAQVLNLPKEETQFERIYRQFMDQVGAQHVQDVSDTTKKRIQQAIRNSFDQELALPATAQAIRDSVGGAIGQYRSRLIARTETHAAAGFANFAIAKDADIPGMLKRWVSANDNRTRPHHAEMNGTEIPLDQDFEVPYKGIPYKMAYPGDPRGGPGNVCNCRCVLSMVIPDEIEEAPEQPWGDASKDETVFHEQSWGENDTVRDAIRATKAVPNLIYGVKRAYASGRDQAIAMQTKRGELLDKKDQSVWRHEYGHWIDMQNELPNQPNPFYASSAAYTQFVKERESIRKSERKAKKQVAKEQNRIESQYESFDLDAFKDELKGQWITADDLLEIGGERLRSSAMYRRLVASAVRANYLGDNSFENNNGLANLLNIISRDEGLTFSDFIEAVTNASSGFGHGINYYKKFPKASMNEKSVTVGHTTEAYANYIAMTSGENPRVWRKLLVRFAPSVVDKFDEITEQIAKKGRKNAAPYLRQRPNERRLVSLRRGVSGKAGMGFFRSAYR